MFIVIAVHFIPWDLPEHDMHPLEYVVHDVVEVGMPGAGGVGCTPNFFPGLLTSTESGLSSVSESQVRRRLIAMNVYSSLTVFTCTARTSGYEP